VFSIGMLKDSVYVVSVCEIIRKRKNTSISLELISTSLPKQTKKKYEITDSGVDSDGGIAFIKMSYNQIPLLSLIYMHLHKLLKDIHSSKTYDYLSHQLNGY